MNRLRFVVVLQRKIHVFDLATMRSLHAIETPPNPLGIAALSSDENSCYLIYPESTLTGTSTRITLIFPNNPPHVHSKKHLETLY